jgi:hypothetical protein
MPAVAALTFSNAAAKPPDRFRNEIAILMLVFDYPTVGQFPNGSP